MGKIPYKNPQNPNVSIILLNYNGWEDTLRCLDSVYRTKYPNLKLFLVDNGSSDSSIDQFKKWATGEIITEPAPMITDSPIKPSIEIKEFTYNPVSGEVNPIEGNSDNSVQGNLDNSIQDNSIQDNSNNSIQDISDNSVQGNLDNSIPGTKDHSISGNSDYSANGNLDYGNQHLNEISIIKIVENCGFTGGNNIALNYILENVITDYIMLLSNDVILDADSISEMIQAAETDDKIGIIGPMVYNYHDSLRVQSAGVDIEWTTGKQLVYCQNELNCHVEADCTDVDFVSGCVMIIRKNVCEKVGNLKENYFAYWEETEWCTRVKKAGNRVICANNAKAWHKEAATTTKNPGFVEYHITRNMFYFMKEHASKNNYRSFLLYFFGYQIFYMSGFYILKARDSTRLKYFWKGIIHGLTSE